MPKPNEYRTPGKDFFAFLRDAQSELDAATSNVTYTTVQSVFIVFRRRLTVQEGIVFASVLPPVLCALFIKDWDTSAPKIKFDSLKKMNAEVQNIKAAHNFSPDDSIQKVATTLLKHVDKNDFIRVVERMSPEAKRFWQL